METNKKDDQLTVPSNDQIWDKTLKVLDSTTNMLDVMSSSSEATSFPSDSDVALQMARSRLIQHVSKQKSVNEMPPCDQPPSCVRLDWMVVYACQDKYLPKWAHFELASEIGDNSILRSQPKPRVVDDILPEYEEKIRQPHVAKLTFRAENVRLVPYLSTKTIKPVDCSTPNFCNCFIMDSVFLCEFKKHDSQTIHGVLMTRDDAQLPLQSLSKMLAPPADIFTATQSIGFQYLQNIVRVDLLFQSTPRIRVWSSLSQADPQRTLLVDMENVTYLADTCYFELKHGLCGQIKQKKQQEHTKPYDSNPNEGFPL